MADFPFNEPSPFDLSDCVLLDEGPVECPPMPASMGQLPTVGNTGSARSASYVDSGSSSGGGSSSNSSTRQVNRVFVIAISCTLLSLRDMCARYCGMQDRRVRAKKCGSMASGCV